MITTKTLYMLQDERELPFVYNIGDSAVCIAGKEIRIPFPGGYKIFVEKVPEMSNGINFDINKRFQEQDERINRIQQMLQQMNLNPASVPSQEVHSNDNQGQSHRNSF